MIYWSDHSQNHTNHLYCYSFCQIDTMKENTSAGFNSITRSPTLPILVPINSHTFITQSYKHPLQWAAELLDFPLHITPHTPNISRTFKNSLLTFCLLYCDLHLQFSTDNLLKFYLCLHVPGWLIQSAVHHFPTWFHLHLLGSREVEEEI